MKVLKNLFSISLTASILSASFSAYGNEAICKDAFQTTNTTTTSITKSITVRAHFKKLGLLKADNEIQQLSAGDKELYLTMIELDYSKAQEIMRLFATFPIMTSLAIREAFYQERRNSSKNLKNFIADSRATDRKKIAKVLTVALKKGLRVDGHIGYVVQRNFEELTTASDVEAYRDQERILIAFGIPKTMLKEISEFFKQIDEREFKFIEALFYRNFETIALASEPLNPVLKTTVAGTQAVGTAALTSGAISLGLNLLGMDPNTFSVMGAVTLFGGILGAFAHYEMFTDSFKHKISLSGWVNRTKQLLTAKMKQKKIKQDLLALSGLDPKSIKPLPTVQQLKEQPNSSLAKLLIPALENRNILAYPELDLNRFEESLEQQISIEEIDKLEPSFENFGELAQNPFELLPYGVELTRPQNLIIAREDVLTEKFRQLSERMGVWQKKRNLAKSPEEKTWAMNEKSNLTELLSEHATDNSKSWKYLTSLKSAVLRFDNYLVDVIKPHAGESIKHLEVLHEGLQLVIFQIDTQFESLKERAKSISTLLANLKI